MGDLATGNNLYRGFNTADSELNTPDIADLDIGKILGTQDIADLINAADTETENRMETREDVWGHESFDIFQTAEYGLCLPATLVEDQEIDPLSSCNVSPSEQTEEVKRVSVIGPVS